MSCELCEEKSIYYYCLWIVVNSLSRVEFIIVIIIEHTHLVFISEKSYHKFKLKHVQLPFMDLFINLETTIISFIGKTSEMWIIYWDDIERTCEWVTPSKFFILELFVKLIIVQLFTKKIYSILVYFSVSVSATFLDTIICDSGILSKFIRLSTIVIDYCVDFRLIYVSELSRNKWEKLFGSQRSMET